FRSATKWRTRNSIRLTRLAAGRKVASYPRCRQVYAACVHWSAARERRFTRLSPLRLHAIAEMNFDSSFLEQGRVYVIGDIHGRSDLLDRMIAAISADL